MDVDRVPVSIVCVFNDARVREECLDWSISRLRADTTAIDYIPVDNTTGTFSTAGAALMSGVARARRDVVVFVHQDVVLHSIEALERAAGLLGESYALLGAMGVTREGRFVGRIRDRIVLLGDANPGPIVVDSVDEVLFLADRATLLREPLSQADELGWHAYAVEYGLRMRSKGKRVGAVSIPLSHNSMSTNLARLSDSHYFLAKLYPQERFIQTTCGVVRPRPLREKRLSTQRWRYRWVRESTRAARIRRRTGVKDVVLSDIRLDIDRLLDVVPGNCLRIVNLDRDGTFDDLASLRLRRRDAHAEVSSMTLTEIVEILEGLVSCNDCLQYPSLFTNLEESDLLPLVIAAPDQSLTIGIHQDAGCWLLVGATPLTPRFEPSATPFRPQIPPWLTKIQPFR